MPHLRRIAPPGSEPVEVLRLVEPYQHPHRWCDNLSNNDPKVLTFMSKGFANMVVQMAFNTTVLGSSATSVHKPAQSTRTSARQRGSAR